MSTIDCVSSAKWCLSPGRLAQEAFHREYTGSAAALAALLRFGSP